MYLIFFYLVLLLLALHINFHAAIVKSCILGGPYILENACHLTKSKYITFMDLTVLESFLKCQSNITIESTPYGAFYSYEVITHLF